VRNADRVCWDQGISEVYDVNTGNPRPGDISAKAVIFAYVIMFCYINHAIGTFSLFIHTQPELRCENKNFRA
jgi:hypothetical protein